MYFIMKVIIARQIFSANLIYPFQVQLSSEYCFEAGIYAQICLKLRHSYWKIAKNRSALGALLPDLLCFRRLEATSPDRHISLISLQILRCALNYKRHFHVIKEKDGNIIKLVSKSASVERT